MKHFLFMVGCCLWSAIAFSKPIEIEMWHALAGQLGSEFNQVVDQFNRSQQAYHVHLVYKGNYTETLTAFSAAYRAHTPPALLQVFEVGSTIMMYPKGVVKPVGQLFKENGQHFPVQSLWPVLSHYYVQQGELQALPLNVSFPVMYYNADRLKQLGYTSDNFPHTWKAFENVLHELQLEGSLCGYTSAYPAWIHIEAFMALHGLNPLPMQVAYTHPAFHTHLKRLERWHRLHWFEYAGRLDEATVLFTSGRCPLFSQSSGAHANLLKVAPFTVGVAPLPYDHQSVKKRAANVAGGGAIWVIAGQTAAVEAGIVQFFKFLMQPDLQQRWYQHTGYLPILKQPIGGSHMLFVDSEWGEVGEIPAPLLYAQQRVRLMNDELLESLFAGLISVDEMPARLMRALGYAQARFEKNHGV